jgi:hypothetical protein
VVRAQRFGLWFVACACTMKIHQDEGGTSTNLPAYRGKVVIAQARCGR